MAPRYVLCSCAREKWRGRTVRATSELAVSAHIRGHAASVIADTVLDDVKGTLNLAALTTSRVSSC